MRIGDMQRARRQKVRGRLLAAGVVLGLLLPFPGEGRPPERAWGAQETEQLPPGAPTPTPEAHTVKQNTYKQDSIVIKLEPLDWVEYKYGMEQGDTMVYSWVASVPVKVEMHSEPEGGPQGYAEFFERAEKARGHGSYKAPFSGIHGWYWENLEEHPITITITSSGFFSSAQEFRYGTPPKTYELMDVTTLPEQ